ncbi:MAG: type II secretion system protein GspK, partial [Armatimonadota bacterium]
GSGPRPRAQSPETILYAQLLAQAPRPPGGAGGGFPGGMPGGGGQEPPPDAGEPRAPGDEVVMDEEPPLLEDPVAGLININTAPIEVLATLPQMTEEIVNAIANRRDSEPFAGRGDIAHLESVDPQVLGQLLEHITVNSNSYRMYALGTIDETEIAVHVTAVVDMTESPARIRYFRQDN